MIELTPPSYSTEFDRRVWCACRSVELADDEDLIGDAADDDMVHGAALCLRIGGRR